MSGDPDRHSDLLTELRVLLDRSDPVPPQVDEFAKAALGWRRLDAELAELLADSALETASAAPTRSGATASSPRWLTFRASELTIDVEVDADGGARTVLGQLAPPLAGALVELQAADGAVVAAAETDALGRFRLVWTKGRVRFRLQRSDRPAPALETSWLVL